MLLTRQLKAIRTHDMQPGLTSVKMGLINLYMERLKLLGSVAQISSIIKGLNVISYEGLVLAAGDVGIDRSLLENALRELEIMDFVRVIRKGGSIERVEEQLPLLADFYDVLGERLEQHKLSEIESASLQILDDLSILPIAAVELQDKHGLDPKVLHYVKEIGINTGFIDTYVSPTDSREIFFSPLYWDENPVKYFELTEKFGTDKVIQRLKALRSKQGYPVDLIKDPIICEAIELGCLPTPEVDSIAGRKAFAFTPRLGVSKVEKSLLSKARAIIACLRYGQHFGTITKIRNPELFLRKLLERGRTKLSHSEIPQQWDLARKLGIGFFDRELGTDRYFFCINPHEDNKKAFELAIQMVSIGDIEKHYEEEEEARDLLLPGAFTYPTVTRLRVKREAKYSRDSIVNINDLIRGARSDLFE